MRIRSLKPFIWEDEKFGSVSRGSRLLYIGLITLSDDQGRFRTSTSVIVGHVYPYDRDAHRRVPGWLRELDDAGLIHLYGGQYGYLPGWEKHQRISHASPSLLPEPPRNNSGVAPEPLRTLARGRGGGGGGGGGGGETPTAAADCNVGNRRSSSSSDQFQETA